MNVAARIPALGLALVIVLSALGCATVAQTPSAEEKAREVAAVRETLTRMNALLAQLDTWARSARERRA
jgi:hypothetical protein